MALKLASMRNRSPCQNPEKDAENAQEEQSKKGRELHPYRRFTEKCRYKPYLPSLIMASARLVVIWVLQTPLKQGWRPWWCQPPGMWSASPSTWHRERTWRDLSWSVNPLQFSYQTWELKPCLHPPAIFSDDSAIIRYISKAEEAMTGSFIIWRKHKHLQLIVTKTKELCPSRGVIVDIVEDYTWECTLTIICDLRTRSSFPLISNRNWSHSTAITCLPLAHLNSLPSYSTVHSCVQQQQLQWCAGEARVLSMQDTFREMHQRPQQDVHQTVQLFSQCVRWSESLDWYFLVLSSLSAATTS